MSLDVDAAVMPRAQRALSPQLAALVLGTVLAAVLAAETFAGLLASYALAWFLLNLAVARGVRLPVISRRALWLGTSLVLVTPLFVLAQRFATLTDAESLIGLRENLRDRMRVERSPAIHPSLVADDRPQTFFVQTNAAKRLRVTLAPGVRAIDAESLGHGLYRVDYDPRVQGQPRRRGAAEALLEVDGSVTTRTMNVVRASAHPRWLRVSPDGTRACTTSEETDEMFVVDAHGALRRFPSADGPIDCAFTDATTVAVAHRYSSSVTLVALGNAPTTQLELGAAQLRLAMSPDGALLAVALETQRGEVALIDLATHEEVARAAIGGLADGVTFAADARSVIVARHLPAALMRLAFDGHALRVAHELPLLAPATELASAEHGTRVILATTDWRADATPHLGNHYIVDQLLAFDTGTLALISQQLTARRSPRQDAAGNVDRGISPAGVYITPSGGWLVAFAGSDELTRFDPRGGEPRSFDVAELGLAAPHSVVALGEGDARVLVATSPSNGRIALLDAVTGELRASHLLAPDDATLLRDDQDALRVRVGERAFYESTRAGVSCQSCHPHGGTDGIAHNIGGRLLAPTLTVQGIAGTSPYLRDGSYPRIGDLLEVAEVRYRGYREPAGDRSATLDAWVSSLPLPRSLAARDLPRERRGFDVFVEAGCVGCHAPPAMTNLGRHPTHTVFPRAHAAAGASLDTPSLRAVSRRSRWLQDGRAHSLRAIFTQQNPDDRHGRTRALSRASLDDLVVFLESL